MFDLGNERSKAAGSQSLYFQIAEADRWRDLILQVQLMCPPRYWGFFGSVETWRPEWRVRCSANSPEFPGSFPRCWKPRAYGAIAHPTKEQAKRRAIANITTGSTATGAATQRSATVVPTISILRDKDKCNQQRNQPIPWFEKSAAAHYAFGPRTEVTTGGFCVAEAWNKD